MLPRISHSERVTGNPSAKVCRPEFRAVNPLKGDDLSDKIEWPAATRLCLSTVSHHAHAYASTRGSAPALSTPVFGSMMMAALDASDQGGATCNL